MDIKHVKAVKSPWINQWWIWLQLYWTKESFDI